MKPTRFRRYGVLIATGVALFAAIAACETDKPGSTVFEANNPSPTIDNPAPPSAPAAASPAVDAGAPDAQAEAAVPPACDDGKIDPGETCDPLASCPTSCPAAQCQLRRLDAPGTCGAKCATANADPVHQQRQLLSVGV